MHFLPLIPRRTLVLAIGPNCILALPWMLHVHLDSPEALPGRNRGIPQGTFSRSLSFRSVEFFGRIWKYEIALRANLSDSLSVNEDDGDHEVHRIAAFWNKARVRR
jgi:hypothetical protein